MPPRPAPAVVQLPPPKKPVRAKQTPAQREYRTAGREIRKTQAEASQQSLAQVAAKRRAERASISQRSAATVRTQQGVSAVRRQEKVQTAAAVHSIQRRESVAQAKEIESARTRAYYKRHVIAPVAARSGERIATAINPIMLVIFTMGGLITFYLFVTHSGQFSGFTQGIAEVLGTISKTTPLFVKKEPVSE